jgi:hypothetical protein
VSTYRQRLRMVQALLLTMVLTISTGVCLGLAIHNFPAALLASVLVGMVIGNTTMNWAIRKNTERGESR